MKMYSTTWYIEDEIEHTVIEYKLYHFGKEPKFPARYLQEGKTYKIKMLWNLKLLFSLRVFLKCLMQLDIIQVTKV